MKRIDDILEHVTSVAIAGHVHPDGDCIGSCMAMYGYIRENYPDIQAEVYLESVSTVFNRLSYLDAVKNQLEDKKEVDLFLMFDVSSEDRIAVAADYLKTAGKTVCIDHHITNIGLGQINHIEPEASSTCEVLFGLMDREKISKATALALYTGIIHDSGVFQYSNTSGKTMEIGAWLIRQGIPFTQMIEESFYMKSDSENRIMGHVLENNQLFLEGKCIVGIVSREDMEKYQTSSDELGGIIAQLRLTIGVEAAVFLYEIEPGIFKVSMRSNGKVDVSRIALLYGGGGHKMAAGCTMENDPAYIIGCITQEIEKQLGSGRK